MLKLQNSFTKPLRRQDRRWQAILDAIVAEKPRLTEGEIRARLLATISASKEICGFIRARVIQARFRTVLEEHARCREYSAEAGSGSKRCQAAGTLCAFVRMKRARVAYVQQRANARKRWRDMQYRARKKARKAEVGKRLAALVGDWWEHQPTRRAPRRKGPLWVRDGATQTEVAIVTDAVVVAATQVPAAGPLYPPRLPRPARWDVEDDLVLEDDLELCGAVPHLRALFPKRKRCVANVVGAWPICAWPPCTMWWPRLEPYIEPNDNEIEEEVDEYINIQADVFVFRADVGFMQRAFRDLHDHEWAHHMALRLMN